MAMFKLDADTHPKCSSHSTFRGPLQKAETDQALKLVTSPAETAGVPHIVVMGVGGGGGNALSNMAGSDLQGVTLVAANTDRQALAQVRCAHKLQLGTGLGAGARPHVATEAAEAATDAIAAALDGADMLFVAAGLGGGTGTGAAPAIARLARQRGILTVGVVTIPFAFEGVQRAKIAEEGIHDLLAYTDTLIVIPNQRAVQIADTDLSLKRAFSLVDDVLLHAVQTISDLVVKPGLVNLDFADVATILKNKGTARIGSGAAEGPGRALRAASIALTSQLMGETPISEARGILVNVSGSASLSILEVDQAVDFLRQHAHPEANIIFGAQVVEELADEVRVSIVATGLESDARSSVGNSHPSIRTRLDQPSLTAQHNRSTSYERVRPDKVLERRIDSDPQLQISQAGSHPYRKLEPYDTTQPRTKTWRGVLVATIACAGVCGAAIIAAWNMLLL